MLRVIHQRSKVLVVALNVREELDHGCRGEERARGEVEDVLNEFEWNNVSLVSSGCGWL